MLTIHYQTRFFTFLFTVFFLSTSTPVLSDGGITYEDIAAERYSGVDYERTPSPRQQLVDKFKQRGYLELPEDVMRFPMHARGKPGIAIFDYDNDGDLDIYVTNGPGTPNSLYVNQLSETGVLTYIDVALQAGVEATAQDSQGVVFGDIDNDGFQDLYILVVSGPNILFRNNGDGTFTDITEESGTGGGDRTSSSAAMGDINGNGLLDIFVGNFGKYIFSNIFGSPFELTEHNQLFVNLGNNKFQDVSNESGIENLNGFSPDNQGSAGPTWAVAAVDYDLDGDLDLFSFDDQGGILVEDDNGTNRGIIHLHINDGKGNFKDVNVEAGIAIPGGWMGVSFGDFNSDGHLDFFATNLGSYGSQSLTNNPSSFWHSQLFLGTNDNRFILPESIPSVFGWGTSAFDFDNDGDTDILYHGGLENPFIFFLDNPGLMLKNDGQANFSYDLSAKSATDHTLRSVQGMAVGDLNNDGFVDIISVSDFNVPETAPLIPRNPEKTPLDGGTYFMPSFVPSKTDASRADLNPEIASGLNLQNGTLSVEISSADNGNNWAQIKLMGSKGIVSDGKVNRDGIGAIVKFTPKGGKTIMQPILGGSSHLSQDSLIVSVGLGNAHKGKVEILWPGGTRNILFNVKAGERLVIPEIPVSYTDTSLSRREYKKKLRQFLEELSEKGVVTSRFRARLHRSATLAYIKFNKTKH